MQQSQASQNHQGMKERRAYPRFLPTMEVRELVPGKHSYDVRTVSAGGLSCVAEVGYQPGILVVLEIKLNKGLMPFSAPARVVRSERVADGYETSFQFLMPQVQMIPYLKNA